MSSGSLPSPPANDSSPARSHFEGRAGLSRLYTDTDACVLAHTRTRALSLTHTHTHTHVRMPRFCMHLLRCAAPPTYRHKHTHLWENILDVFKTQLVRFVRHVACSRIGKFALLLHTYHHPCAGAPKCKSTNAKAQNYMRPRRMSAPAADVHLHPAATRALASVHRAGLPVCARTRAAGGDANKGNGR